MAMAVTDVVGNAVTYDSGTGDLQTANLPTAGVLEGHMMVLTAAITIASGDPGDILGTPSGYTKAGTALASAASGVRNYIFWREVPSGGLGATINCVGDSSFNTVFVAFAVKNCDTSALDIFGTAATGTSTSLDCPAVTASGTGGLIVRVGWIDNYHEAASQPSMSGHTIVNQQTAPTPANGMTVAAWVAVQPSTSVGTSSATITSEEWGAQTFVISEGAAGTTDVNFHGTGRGILRGIGRGIG